jgi:hypothetical protein
MELAAIDPDQATTIVAVLGAVATARGTQPASEADLAVIRAASRHLLGNPRVSSELAHSIPGEVTEVLATPDAREITLTIASILCFADAAVTDDTLRGFLDPARVTVVDDLARYLRVSALDVLDIRRLVKFHRDRVAFDLFRRFPLASDGGDGSMVDAAVRHAESRVDIDSRHVHALWSRAESMPSGTVGAELVRYYRDNDWPYPGSDHHLPLRVVDHDVHHILGGYPTTSAGEIALGAFLAGVARRPIDGARTFLLWEQLTAGSTAAIGPDPFDVETFLLAFDRGFRTTVDFSEPGWDAWSIVDFDLARLREQYGIGGGAPLEAGDPYDLDPLPADHEHFTP